MTVSSCGFIDGEHRRLLGVSRAVLLSKVAQIYHQGLSALLSSTIRPESLTIAVIDTAISIEFDMVRCDCSHSTVDSYQRLGKCVRYRYMALPQSVMVSSYLEHSKVDVIMARTTITLLSYGRKPHGVKRGARRVYSMCLSTPLPHSSFDEPKL
ncbi:hypothetical protein HBI27_129810 [Parastagonospora nodorum]|nr:hypothetical protein HBI27_129810 [Parastagonospora nodorum]